MLRPTFRSIWASGVVIVLGIGQASLGAQQQPNAKNSTVPAGQSGTHLTRVTTITSPTETATGFLTPVKCDGNGNIYFRRDHRDAVHKLNGNAQQVASFQPAANAEKMVDLVVSFALTPRGDVYQLVALHELDRYMFVYRPDGSFKSAVKLKPGSVWFPHALGVFPSGQVLIAGSEYDHDRTAAKWPFTGIFAEDGSLLKEVELEDDVTLHDMGAMGDARVTLPQVPQINRAVDLTQIEMAADGNAYLMRWTNPAIIYGISVKGAVVRRIKLDPGLSGYMPTAMHIQGRQIAVLFVDQQRQDKLMKVISLEGKEIATYDELTANGKPQEPTLGASFACYTENPTRFMFMGANDDYKVQLWIAEPH